MKHDEIILRLQAIGITGDKAAHCFALLDEIKRADRPLSEADYAQLIDAQNELRVLNAAGVDNWEGYEHAMEILERER